MSENVKLFLLIRRLKIILPLDRYRFIEQESLKLLKSFEHIYEIQCSDEIPATSDCIELYNQWRPQTSIGDTVMIKVFCKYITDGIPLEFKELFQCLEEGYLVVGDDWRIEISHEEEERQKKLPDFKGWFRYDRFPCLDGRRE